MVRNAEIETNPEAIGIATPSDLVVLIAFKMDAPQHAGYISLVYPHFTLESVLPKLV